MGHVEKTVFICYRRANMAWALAVYQYLTSHGYDVFFDYLSIPSGDFERVIIENIKARAHFVTILTPSALEKCSEPEDWLRREIETAIDEGRNIVPLLIENFDFSNPANQAVLIGKLGQLKKYQGLHIPSDYFFEAMDRLSNQFLNTALETVMHPMSAKTRKVTIEHQFAANESGRIELIELSAEEWYERGLVNSNNGNFEESLRCLSKSIDLKPAKYSYYERGLVREKVGYFDAAISDYSEAIRIDPEYSAAYNARGFSFRAKGLLEESLKDYHKAIELNPKYHFAYNNLAELYLIFRNFEMARKYFSIAIDLKAKDAFGEEVSLGVILKYLGDKGCDTHFRNALAIWPEANKKGNFSVSILAENKAMALLCLGKKTDALELFIEAANTRLPGDLSNLFYYEMVKESPDPPDGIEDAIEIMKKPKLSEQ